MHEKTVKLLEFDVIRQRVAQGALNEEAARRILEEHPAWDPREAGTLKGLVAAVGARIASGDPEPRDPLPDISFLLPKLGVAGASLALDEAYALGVFIDRGEALKQWLLGGGPQDGAAQKPGQQLLRTLVLALPDCRSLSREVFRVLDKGGKLRDLPVLREIRRRIRSLTRDIEALIIRYTQAEDTRYMLQSSVPAQRDGRTVLAVKANFRGRIKGMVHEVSATGQTLFVEPGEAVEKNNHILIERQRLEREIRRILREMTRRIAEQRQALEAFHEGIIRLETIRARARYSVETQGYFAQEDPERIILKQARHPLLGAQAVPIDITLEGHTKTVIITGPNTGGKTVTLKTLGLLVLMNQFGLALPAAPGTMLPFCDGVYADIGDEQSLSQSLSTFSAHMSTIAAIIAHATEKSLVLLDELGAGTDPEEGSAIAMAILDHLMEKQVRLIATTHQGSLKHYGYTQEQVENASVEFDAETLSPTYRILMGVPGESRAVDIAARNGIPQAVINRARSYLRDERADVSALIQGLTMKHQELNTALERQQKEEERLREERRQAVFRELRLRQQETELKAGEVGKLRRLLEESRKTLENLVREVKEGELSREKTVKVKQFLHDLETTVAIEDTALKEDLRLLAAETVHPPSPLSSIPQAPWGSATQHRPETKELYYPSPWGALNPPAGTGLQEPGPRTSQFFLKPGTPVLVGKYRRPGRVFRADKNGSWVVEIGSLKMSFPEQDLYPFPAAEEQPQPAIALPDLASELSPRFELNLRGMRLEEAIEALRRQIDAAVLSGLREFSVIHGTGAGVLQQGVHTFLSEQPQVAEYYFSRPELGGFGRTEVVMKC
ncbi:MAG: Smr/MutS family protein [Treponema sp.]|jgi:DNA mismatch repair protein MutS2|nr:Smr/MutS family protein [Treponema sp.]